MSTQPSSTGVLLVNLGSPDSTSVADVRKYLREFLMDPRVIDIPYPARLALVHGIIAPFRAAKSAEAYRKIWTSEGSPLIATSSRLASLLQHQLGIPVELAMRYQKPRIAAAVQKLTRAGVRRVLVLPLFPHYAMSSYESAVVEVRHVVAITAPELVLDVVPPYFDHPRYIDALVAAAGPALAAPYDHLLFSFHGVPERHILKTDPTGCHCLKSAGCCEAAMPASPNSEARISAHQTCYRRQCLATVNRFAALAGLKAGAYSYAFQSRLGRDKWLEPATQHELVRLAKAGVRRLLVICPAFTVDCLETIEEIGIRGKRDFVAAGGADLSLIPCLNDHPVWVKALSDIAHECGVAPMAVTCPEAVEMR